MDSIWEVDFEIIGPVSLKNNTEFTQEKGFERHQFYSNIKLTDKSYGFSATITAKADSIETAEIVAHVYLGRMIDVISLINDIPIQLIGNETIPRINDVFKSRRLLTKSDIKIAFNMARKFETEHPKLLRAIGWYSKGKNSRNTFDEFLAYWNVLEILGKEYHTPTDRTKKGIKNQIYQCFTEYFGAIKEWELPEMWIDKMYESRNRIFHGGEDNTLEVVKRIAEQIPLLSITSKRLIDSIIDSNYTEIDFVYFDF